MSAVLVTGIVLLALAGASISLNSAYSARYCSAPAKSSLNRIVSASCNLARALVRTSAGGWLAVNPVLGQSDLQTLDEEGQVALFADGEDVTECVLTIIAREE